MGGFRTWVILAALVFVAGLALIVSDIRPPGSLTMAAGPAGGGYYKLAERYREVLARDGIKLRIVETAGSVENAGLLERREVDAAILQGGIAVNDPLVEAIGSLFYEPMSFLVREGSDVSTNPADWSGLRISSGKPGSGTYAAYRDFEAAVRLDPDANTHLAMSYGQSISALAGGQIDVAVFVTPVDAPYMVAAYQDPSIRFLPLEHTEAIARRLVYANTVVVPDGAVSLRPVQPPVPWRLIALEARMAIVPDLHPALVNRLAIAAKELHSGRSIITDPGTFPTVEGTGLPVNNVARQLIVEGPSAWHDWLPYWMAAQINRFLLLLLPFVFIGVPLLQAMPGLYAYLMRWRVWQYYPEIRQIEERLDEEPDGAALNEIEARLESVDERLSRLRLPAAYRQTSYDARIHIELVQKRIAVLRRKAEAG